MEVILTEQEQFALQKLEWHTDNCILECTCDNFLIVVYQSDIDKILIDITSFRKQLIIDKWIELYKRGVWEIYWEYNYWKFIPGNMPAILIETK